MTGPGTPRTRSRGAGIDGIAAAPDFTEDAIWAGFDAAQRQRLELEGRIAVPSEYADEPYVVSRRLIEDGRTRLVLRSPLPLPFPVRLLHGSVDRDVVLSVPLRLLAHADCPDMRTVVKDADHRFSAPDNLELVARTLDEIA